MSLKDTIKAQQVILVPPNTSNLVSPVDVTDAMALGLELDLQTITETGNTTDQDIRTEAAIVGVESSIERWNIQSGEIYGGYSVDDVVIESKQGGVYAFQDGSEIFCANDEGTKTTGTHEVSDTVSAANGYIAGVSVGITDTKVFDDNSGATHTVQITGGIITSWTIV